MQVFCNTQEQHRVLEKEDRPQQTTRHRKTHPTAPSRLAHNHHLGMRTPTQEPPHHPTGYGADLEQDIPAEQWCKSHNALLLRRREHRNGGGKIKHEKQLKFAKERISLN